jgi:hypothetical protein
MVISVTTLPFYKRIPIPYIQKAQNTYISSLNGSAIIDTDLNKSISTSDTSLSNFEDCISECEECVIDDDHNENIYNIPVINRSEFDRKNSYISDYYDKDVDKNNEVITKQLETISSNNKIIHDQTRMMNDILAKIQEYNKHLQGQMYSYTYNTNIIQQQLQTIQLQNEEINKNNQELDVQNQSIENFNTFIQSTCSTYTLPSEYYS